MSRLVAVTVRSLTLTLGLAGHAAAQEPPALEPPSLEPPRAGSATAEAAPKPTGPGATPPPPPPVARPAAPRVESRPMLAIPGVTAPAFRNPAGSRPSSGGTTPPANGGTPTAPEALPLPSDFPTARAPAGSSGPPLAGPLGTSSREGPPPPLERPSPGMPSAARGITRPGAVPSPPPGESIPLTIEPLDEEPGGPRRAAARPPLSSPLNGRTSVGGSSSSLKDDDEPVAPRPAPRRPPGLFGRLFAPPPAPLPPPRESSRAEDKGRTRRDSDADDATDRDLVARRRIERQVRATLGDKVRSFDVNVTGRNVTIFAQPSRFWLRRSVRRSLETLPALQGYRARIEVGE